MRLSKQSHYLCECHFRRRANLESSPAVSPANSPVAPSSSLLNQKRQSPASGAEYPQPPKRQRIAHTNPKPLPSDPNAPKVNAKSNAVNQQANLSAFGKEKLKCKCHWHPPNVSLTEICPLCFNWDFPNVSLTEIYSNLLPHSSAVESPNSLGESQENNNYLGDASPDKDAPDFVRCCTYLDLIPGAGQPMLLTLCSHCSQYPSIRNSDQRQRYKKDFNAEYEEYRELHAEINKVSAMFRTLVHQLHMEQKGSEGYEVRLTSFRLLSHLDLYVTQFCPLLLQNMKNRFFSEYDQVKKDPKYIAQRKRCDYLYKKLGHIKKLITEFDNQVISEPVS